MKKPKKNQKEGGLSKVTRGGRNTCGELQRDFFSLFSSTPRTIWTLPHIPMRVRLLRFFIFQERTQSSYLCVCVFTYSSQRWIGGLRVPVSDVREKKTANNTKSACRSTNQLQQVGVSEYSKDRIVTQFWQERCGAADRVFAPPEGDFYPTFNIAFLTPCLYTYTPECVCARARVFVCCMCDFTTYLDFAPLPFPYFFSSLWVILSFI